MIKINGIEMDGRKVAKIIKTQPGYSANGAYMVTRNIIGGFRLYKFVSGKWMDASLSDVAELKKYVII